jgi:hypothetical protein
LHFLISSFKRLSRLGIVTEIRQHMLNLFIWWVFISLLLHLFFPYFNLFVSIFIQYYVNIKLHVSTLYRY